jgi:Protein of unknown function (DUF1360)
MAPNLEDVEPFAGHAPDGERPLGGYAVMASVFAGLVGGFSAWLRASGRELPERIEPGDLALVTVATHKASRLITKEHVASPVRAPFTRFEAKAGQGETSESPRGHGVRRAIGELLVCPYCLGLWIAAAFSAGLIVAPRATRWVATVLTTLFGSDVLQIAYRKAEDAL